MSEFPDKKARKKFYEKEGRKNYQQKLYANPSDWIHHRIRDLNMGLLKKALAVVDKAKVLDIGCAEGIYLQEVSPLINKGIGIDIAANKIKRAKKLTKELKNLRFFTKDFLDRQEKVSFDIVFSTETLEHIPYIEKALRKINRLLENKGIFICSVPTDKEMLFYHYSGDWQKASGHLYNWSKKEFQRLLQVGGFKIIGTCGVNNVITQIISQATRFILNKFKKRKKIKMNKKLITIDGEKNKISYLTKGARFFYQLDEFFTSLPIFKNFNNYNIFVCQKKCS